MEDESPVTKVTYAILVSALKKRASEIWIHRVGEQALVEFCIDGVAQVEMQPPQKLHEAIIRRLSVMASLPSYAKGHVASGTIHLMIGERDAWFELQVRGHGAELEARLSLQTPEQAAKRNEV